MRTSPLFDTLGEEAQQFLTNSQGYFEEDSKLFSIRFDLLLGIEAGKELAIAYDAFFECDEAIDDEFKNSHFPRVNAPAIAFPYLRAFISTVTLNAGYPVIMLPSWNFQAMDQQHNTP
jgi:preprotein translocase subunit SecB